MCKQDAIKDMELNIIALANSDKVFIKNAGILRAKSGIIST